MTTTISKIDPAVTGSITLIEPIVILDRDMVWTDEYLWKAVTQTNTPTIDGGMNVQRYAKTEKGRPITLESLARQGAQKKSTVDALWAQAEDEDAKYYLEISHNAKTLQKVVIYRNDLDPGPIQMKMSSDMDGLQIDTFNYRGSIHFQVDTWP